MAANGAYVFAAHAVYPDGSERNVSSKATWSVTPADATVLQGVLTTGSLAVPEEMLTVGASYTEGPSTVTAETQVRFLAADPAEGPNSWPMYQADARHSGFVASAVDPTLFTLHWRKDFTETNSLNPVAAGEGKVFLSFYSYSASHASIFALDAADGTQLWSKDFESGLGIDAPSLGYGNVYVRLSDGYSSAPIVVLTGDSGSELLRTVETQQSIYYHSPLAPTLFDRHLYVADGGSLMSIDASSGAHDWQVQTPEDAQTAPAVQSLDVWLYSRQPAGAWSYVRSNGDVNLAAPDPAGEYNSYLAGTAPVLGDQNDLIVVTAGRVISFDTVAGTIRWQVLGQYTGQPSVHGGSIYVINGGQLQVLDEATHAAQWSWSAPEGSINAPLILTPSFVFASTSSAVHAVSLATKQEVWSYPAAGRLALADSTLYVAGASQLYAFGPPQPPPALGFFTIAPCRIFDTRVASGESAGAPPIFGLSFRIAQVTGKCGIPSGARSISANVTAIDGTGPGELQIGARQGVAFLPVVSYSTVGARANNAMLGLDTNGTLTIAVQGNLSSTYNMAIDVNGYFQ